MSTEESLISRRPHDVHPSLPGLFVVQAIKNFAAIPGVCHIGLGVTAANNVKVLRRNSIDAVAWPAQTTKELRVKIEAWRGRPITHVIISAPSWVQPPDFQDLALTHPNIQFVQLNHSGTSYLSIDKYGIRNIREVMNLALSFHNVHVAGNNPRFVRWLRDAFGYRAPELTNLYDTTNFIEPVGRRAFHDPLRIGSFGAGRPWKNQLSAAEGAVALARSLGVNLEFYVNTMRPDGGERMIEARRELFKDLPGTKLIEVPWALWSQFRRIVSTLDLLFSPSFDETFNVVTADGIAEGVPSVVTEAIEWCPRNWMCDPWDPASLMTTARGILHHPNAISEGRHQLKQYVKHGIRNWKNFLLQAEDVEL